MTVAAKTASNYNVQNVRIGSASMARPMRGGYAA